MGGTTVAVALLLGAADADAVGTAVANAAHFAYEAFVALATLIWNSPIPLLCCWIAESGLVLSTGDTEDCAHPCSNVS